MVSSSDGTVINDSIGNSNVIITAAVNHTGESNANTNTNFSNSSTGSTPSLMNNNNNSTTTTTTNMSSKRKRRTIRKPYYYSSSAVEHIENRCLMQAIQNSKVDRQIRRSHHHHDNNGVNMNMSDGNNATTANNASTKSSSNSNNNDEEDEEEEKDIPFGPVFFPTIQQFVHMDPIQYITEHVQPIAIHYGICKIVPPPDWQNHIQKYFTIPVVTGTCMMNENTNPEDNTTTGSATSCDSNSKTNISNDDVNYNNKSDNAEGTGSSNSELPPSTPHGSRADQESSNETITPIPVTPSSTTARSHCNESSPNTSSNTPSETAYDGTNNHQKKAFETKYQLLHRIQEGIDFQDGNMYTSTEYIQMAYQQTLQYKNAKYPLHDLLSKYQSNSNKTCSSSSIDPPHNDDSHSTNSMLNDSPQHNTKNTNVSKHLYSLQNLEQDYWDIVEMVKPSSDHNSKFVVEYGNDVDTHIYGSGFPLSYDPKKSIYTANQTPMGNKKLNRDDSQRVKKKSKLTMIHTGDGTAAATTSTKTTTTTKLTSSTIDACSTNAHDEENIDESKLQELFQTEEYYRDTMWNLNNIPCAPQSVLRHVKVAINGVNVPWMYYGSLFTTFCWHNEDNYLYSINYHHMGSPKQWYGVPGIPKDRPEGLEKVFKSYLSMKMRDVPDLLHHITTMFSPRLVQNRNVPVYKMIQYEGEFIITFPRAYHCGFSYGPNIGEAVNFATADWIPYGSDANEKYRMNQRPAVFSHDRLVYTMANHCIRDQESYNTCMLIVNELQRMVDEELSLRTKLLNSGVRDVSNLIHLRPNRCDQLDEASANYDDQRTCHYCKYICYFTAVACQCSHSKVSCLRHSHFMCTCANTSKYLMIWSTKAELLATLERVKKHCDYLKEKKINGDDKGSSSLDALPIVSNGDGKSKNKKEKVVLPVIAPGVLEDYERHKDDPILTDPKNWMKRGQNASKPTR